MVELASFPEVKAPLYEHLLQMRDKVVEIKSAGASGYVYVEGITPPRLILEQEKDTLSSPAPKSLKEKLL